MKNFASLMLVAILAMPMLLTGCSKSQQSAEPKDKLHDHYGS